jgi:predicted enzyme related to lactoylglutathione lyase
MHHSRLCAVLIDCKTSDVDQAARFWGEALGRAVDPNHPNSRGNYRILETPPDELMVEIQRVDHDSRVHIDIETDDIPTEVARLEKLGAMVVSHLQRWVVMEAPTGAAIRRYVPDPDSCGAAKFVYGWQDGIAHVNGCACLDSVGWPDRQSVTLRAGQT